MDLLYRGNQYQTETALLEVRETDITGKYRGTKWKYKLPRHIPQVQPKLDLKYRGVSYSTCPNSVKPYFTQQSETPSNRAAETTTSQVTEKNLAQIHLENLRLNLERRIRIAEDNGNENLVAMLEKEFRELQFS